MFQKTLLKGLVVAGVTAAVVVAKLIADRKNNEVEEEDDEIHFVEINDPEEESHIDNVHVDEPTEEDDEIVIQKFDSHPDAEENEDWESHEEEAVSAEVAEIAEMYPYLKPQFISDVLDKNDEFQENFPDDTLVSAAHSITFGEESDLEAFEAIMKEAGYTAEKDGLAIVVSKRFFCEAGAIISDILNVANQAIALRGEYVSYELN